MNDGSYLILLVGFDADSDGALVAHLEEHYEVLEVQTRAEAEAFLEQYQIDLVMCRHSTRLDAIPFLRQARIVHPSVIRVIGGTMSEADAAAAINEAAIYQFFPNGWTPEQIELLVRRALEQRELAFRHRHLSRELKFAEDVLQRQIARMEEQEGRRFDQMLYSNPKMASLVATARKAAETELPVLIQGETGTGKELLARAIHVNSPRRNQAWMVQNCGGLNDDLLLSELFGHKKGAFTGAVSDRLGLFPAADGGTVFLDEIATVSDRFQVALLRFLQNGEVKPLGSDRSVRCNVRVVAACNIDLEKLVAKGEFRQDLYFRLNVFNLKIPPLRERRDEIPVLAEYLARKYGDEIRRRILGIDPELMEKLEVYHWPGNVRELENEIRRLVALTEAGGYLRPANLSRHLAKLPDKNNTSDSLSTIEGDTLKEKVEYLERELVKEALIRFRWNQTQAAEALGISRVGLANKIKRYGLGDESQVA